jgi:hypothetical protein
MNPTLDHSGLPNTTHESCLRKSIDWMWKYTKDYTDLALTKQSAALHKK